LLLLLLLFTHLLTLLSVGYSTSFRTRASLPKPTGLNNILAEEREQIYHEPGQDPLFEQVVNKENQLFGEDDVSDDSSYKFVESPADNTSDDGFSIISHTEADILDE
jgi:hypothetical protein